MKTNSNSYTIIYSTILVVIVAFLLAFVFQALKPAQDANVALDQQKQILFALNQDRKMSDSEAKAKYKQLIVADDIIDADGHVVTKGSQGGTEAGFKLNSKDAKEGRLALYRCNVDGKVKYVIPVYGNGLWGPISGYIAINDDKATVFGAYFNHESETAGLGAEIKDNGLSSRASTSLPPTPRRLPSPLSSMAPRRAIIRLTVSQEQPSRRTVSPRC